jgi:hypothetical protein
MNPKRKKANDQMLNYMIETATLPLDHGANKALSLWKNSKSHNELLLNAKYTGFCVGNQVLDSIIINSITYHSPTRYVVLTMYK